MCLPIQYVCANKIRCILSMNAGLEIKIFSRESNCNFKSHLQVLCIETSTFLGSLQKFEGALENSREPSAPGTP